MQYEVMNPPATGSVVVLQGDFDALGARSVRPLLLGSDWQIRTVCRHVGAGDLPIPRERHYKTAASL